MAAESDGREWLQARVSRDSLDVAAGAGSPRSRSIVNEKAEFAKTAAGRIVARFQVGYNLLSQ